MKASLTTSVALLACMVLMLAWSTPPLFAADTAAVTAAAANGQETATAVTQPVDDIPSLASRLWVLIGHFHPIVVHFPIALLAMAAMVELLRLKYKSISPDIAYACILVAAAGSIPAVIMGWSSADDLKETSTLWMHRWLGIIVTVMAVVLAVFATAARRLPKATLLPKIQTAVLFITAGLVGFVGHLGGDLAYGEGHLWIAINDVINPPKQVIQKMDALIAKKVIEPLDAAKEEQEKEKQEKSTPPIPVPPVLQAPPPATLGGGVPQPPATTPVAAVDFATQIWPIFENKCIKCHGPQKSKAKLRMDSEAEALKWEKDGRKLWVKGDSAQSFILVVIRDTEGLMPPPREGEEVTLEEYELIKTWIDQGAPWPVLPEPTTNVSAAVQ